MAGMGRKRKDGNQLGLERRIEFHHGQFRYLHRDGTKESLGKDIGKANARARVYNDPDGAYGTLGYFVEFFLAEAAAGRLPAGWKLAARTIDDYQREAELMKEAPIWKMEPKAIEPAMLGEYRDKRVVDGKGQIQANHGLALLSSTYSWIIEKGHCPGLVVNPVKLVSRFSRKPKARYVEDGDYRAAYAKAPTSVRMALALVYSTLQRPADVLGLPPSPARWKAVASLQKRVLPVKQGKRGREVDIEVTAELDEAMAMLAPKAGERVIKLALALVHGRGGKGYTEDGMASMLRRACKKADVKSFGLMDVRAKGATDMYLRGVPLETIQLLMAHKSVTTTEIYIKKLLSTISTVAPNRVQVGN